MAYTVLDQSLVQTGSAMLTPNQVTTPWYRSGQYNFNEEVRPEGTHSCRTRNQTFAGVNTSGNYQVLGGEVAASPAPQTL